MRPFPAGRACLAILGFALAFAAMTLALPTSDYQRYELLAGTIHARSRWIYERIHNDPTPIDIVVIGSSRTGAGIDARRLGAETGRHVVNFSLPEAGRNINYAIIDEMLKTKTPKMILLGVTEKPSRTGHSTFRYLAPAPMLLDPGYVGNINYLSDLGYLPYRQMKLFAATLFPTTMELPSTFDPARYAGPVYDTTQDIVLPDGTVKPTGVPAPLPELQRGVRKLEAGMRPPILPARFADYEFGDERTNIRRIAALAQARGIKVAFLALPYYTGPSTVQEADLYRRYGPLWNAGFLASRAGYYSDYAHLTRGGARVLTDWVATRVNALLEPPPAAE
jgi:hypothetical protein